MNESTIPDIGEIKVRLRAIELRLWRKNRDISANDWLLWNPSSRTCRSKQDNEYDRPHAVRNPHFFS
jgi:hypothetical protein